jgi:hypothetical protein
MDGRLNKRDIGNEIETAVKTAKPELRDVRIARLMQDYDIDTDETKVRVEITFTIPRTTKAG